MLLPRPLVTPRYVSSDSHFGPLDALTLPVQMQGADACPPLFDSSATRLRMPSIAISLFLKLVPYVVASSNGCSDWFVALITKPGCGRQNSAGIPWLCRTATKRRGGPLAGSPRADRSRRRAKGIVAARRAERLHERPSRPSVAHCTDLSRNMSDWTNATISCGRLFCTPAGCPFQNVRNDDSTSGSVAAAAKSAKRWR